jgi:hypothetical protein
LKQGCDFLEDPVHAHAGIYGGVDFVMVSAGVHNQYFCSLVGLLDHVRQVMAIVLGQGGTEDDEVKGIAAEGFLNGLTILGSGYVMSGLFHFGGLGGESGFVGLAVKNLDGTLVSGHGQWPSWNSLGA